MMLARKCSSVVSRIRPSSGITSTSTTSATRMFSKGTATSTGTGMDEVVLKKTTIKATNSPVDFNVYSTTTTSTTSSSSGSSSSSSYSSNNNNNNNITNDYQRDFSTAASTTASSFDSPTDSPSPSPSPSPNNNTQTSFSNIHPLDEMEEIINNSDSDFSLTELKELAMQPCTPLSLADMYKYASANISSKNYASQRIRNAQFLYNELPIRIAQRAVDMLTLPHGLNKTQSVQAISHIYLKYLKLFKSFDMPSTEEEELAFTSILRKMVLDRSSIPEAVANGVFALKDHRTEGLDVQRLQTMEKALYRFFNARTGLRLLTEHHVLSCKHFIEENAELRKSQSWVENHRNQDDASSNNSNNSNNENVNKDNKNDTSSSTSMEDNEFGCIQKNCDPTTEARKVADQIVEQCRKRYGISPEIEVIDCTPEHFVNSDFTYVPHHLQYMLAELLKNSCRATIRRYMEGTSTKEDHVHQGGDDDVQQNTSLPSIRVVVAKGEEDVTIKIADKGGGVPRSVIDKMWTFAHSTLSDAMNPKENNGTHFEIDEFTGTSTKGKGFNIRGFGLPLARIYARYFGGELTLKSMEGYGVDAYLYLPVLGVACENLPKRVLKSPGQGDSVHDGNHHVYQGDSFSMSADEPWNSQARHFSTEAFNEKLSKVAL